MIETLQELAFKHHTYGFRKLFAYLRRGGKLWNHKPMQNGYIERFNRLYREAILDTYLLFDLNEVRVLTDEWIEEYNTKRSHESLGNKTPYEWKMNHIENDYALNKTV